MKNGFIHFLSVLFFSGVLFAQDAADLEISGRYSGILHNEKLKRDQLVQLDIRCWHR